MFWLTTFFFLVEIVVGYVTNSMALVADSFHMLSDVAALVVAFLSVKVCLEWLIRLFLCMNCEWTFKANGFSISILYIADVTKKMVQKYFWMG